MIGKHHRRRRRRRRRRQRRRHQRRRRQRHRQVEGCGQPEVGRRLIEIRKKPGSYFSTIFLSRVIFKMEINLLAKSVQTVTLRIFSLNCFIMKLRPI